RLWRARDAAADALARSDDSTTTEQPRALISPELRGVLASLLLAWAGAWWFTGGAVEILMQAPTRYELAWLLGFVAATTLAATFIAVRLEWRRIDWLSLAAWPAALLCFGRVFDGSAAPSSGFGVLGWPALFAALYAFLRLRERRWPLAVDVLHAAALWLATALLVVEAVRRFDAAADGVWPLVAGIVTAAVIVAAIPFLRG